MQSERRNITQPADWWEAFQAQAHRAGLTLSEWLGERAKTGLPKDQRKQLSDRPKTGPKPGGK